MYLTDFTSLHVLKLDSNPITWPPPDVWNWERLDSEAHAKVWLNELKTWLLANADAEIPGNEGIAKHSRCVELVFSWPNKGKAAS